MTKRKKEVSPHYQANNDGGFGNPPVSGQFKGKPGPGRPKGGTTLKTAVQKMLRQSVTMTIDGRRMDVPMTEAMMQRLRKDILTGSPRSLQLGLELAEKYGPAEEELRRTGFNTDDFTRDEMSLFRSFMLRAVEGRPAFDHVVNNLTGTWRVLVREDGFIGFDRMTTERE